MKELPYLPKECWLPDYSSTNCYKCEKSFNALRRKHHCRYCGYIFCSNCSISKHQLEDGTQIKRICEKCLDSIIKCMTKPKAEAVSYPIIPNKHPGVRTVPLIDEINEESAEECENVDVGLTLPEEENAEQRAHEVFEEVNSHEFIQYNEDAQRYLETRVNALLEENALDKSWNTQIIEATKTVVTSICPSVHYRKDSMDINNYLRILKIVDKEKSIKYLKGVVFKKNLAIKRMSKKVQFPKILMLQGNSGFYSEEKKLVSMQELEEQERHYSTMLIKKFNNIKPDVILVEKGMPQILISSLSQYSISIFINVKMKILQLISRLSTGEILEHIDHTSWKTNYLGYCNEFIQESTGDSMIACFIHPDNSYLCGSVLLYGPEKDELKKVSKILREMVLEYRNILLERYVFLQSGMQNIPNIFLEMHSTNSVFKHLSIFGSKPCAKPGVHNIKYYTSNGKALGDYVLNMMVSPETRCESGRVHKLGVHTYYYCKRSGRVRISMHKTNCDFNELMMGKECTRCRKIIINPVQLSKSAWEYSFNKFLDNFFTEIPVSHVTSTCFHDFFKAGNFTFSYRNLQVNIEWEDTEMLNIVQMKTTFNTEYYQELTKNAVKDLKYHSEYVIKEMYRASNELMIQLSSVNSAEFAEDIEKITEELQHLGHSIDAIKSFLPEMNLDKFSNYLEVENYRRNLFLMCCSMKINVVNISAHIRRLKYSDKFKEKSGNSDTTESFSYKFCYNDHESPILSLSETIDEDDDLINSPSFQALQQGCMNFPVGRENLCIPIDENDHFSLIAYALNTQEYYDKVVAEISGPDDLVEVSENSPNTHFAHFLTNFEEEEIVDHMFKESIFRLYGNYLSVYITMYYAKQFHVIRSFKSGTEREILLSLSKSETSSAQLGKSKAYFKFSADRRFLTKVLDEKHFQMFLDLAPNYFRHVYMSSYHNMPSCLLKTLGAYKIQVKNHSTGKSHTEWLVLSENLGYGMPKGIKVYDLKGTDNQRRKVKEGDGRTKMDLNFLEDFKGIPLAVPPEAKRILDASIWNDTLFLSKHNIIDYSLLVMISLESNTIVAGIIDYTEQYTLEKAIESKYKKVVGTEMPTITHPNVYRQRFRTQVTQLYFMSLEN